ncbi:MAG TPA: SDR family NAD(P)-dependent oxidoreductase [Solirubrobacteraceae bacterium]
MKPGARVVLTGASSGIGAELARVFAARGARLAIAARRRERLEALADELGEPPALVFATDLSERGAAAELGREAEAALGGVDVLVNNAGGGVGGRIATVADRDEAREAFEVNYWSPLALIGAVLPGMAERGSGVIVNVTSVAQVNTWPGFGAYAATKGALGVATETLRLELIGTGVHVLEAIPGPVDTAVQGETRLAPGIDEMLDRVPLGDAREMAERIVRAIDRRSAHVIYPRRAAIAYHAPSLARWDTRRAAARVARTIEPETRAALEGLVVRTGSLGDDLARQAREQWERSRGRE